MNRTRPRAPGRQFWPRDALSDMASAWGDWASEMAGAFDTFMDTMAAEPPPGAQTGVRRWERPSRRREHCGKGHQESCHCDCCVYDADLVVYSRVGERRIVPIRISNERTRTRHITLQLSEFTTSGGNDAPVQGEIETRTEFDLEACEREEVVLALQSAASTTDLSKKDRESGRFPDVDDCLVAYADLRIQGCDVRPLRIAVALLPRDCDAYEVHCACGCC